MLLHRGYVTKRDSCRHAIKAGEANMRWIGSILDHIAVQVRHWSIRGADHRCDVLVAKEARES